MIAIIDFLNTIFWGYVLIYGLLAVGVYFTIRLRFQQILHFGEMFRVVMARDTTGDTEGISPVQALCTSLASRVGTGNIAGVAVALTLGGPGAIFWMWMVALVGMATAYSESTLAQLYKVHGPAGGSIAAARPSTSPGGSACPGSGAVFSVCLILSFGLIFNAVQANSIADAMVGAFGIPKLLTGLVLAAMAAMVIFGGIRQIATVAEYVVPVMAGTYLLVALYVLLTHLPLVPGMLAHIVGSRLRPAGGGGRGRRRRRGGDAERREARAVLQRGRHGLGAEYRRGGHAGAAPSVEPGLRAGARRLHRHPGGLHLDGADDPALGRLRPRRRR